MPAYFTSSMYSPYGLNISPERHVRNATATSSTAARPQSIPSVVPAEHDVPDYGNRIPGRVTAGRLTFSVGSVTSPLTDESRKLLRAALSQIDPQQDAMKDSNNMASYFARITTPSGQPADLLVTVLLDSQHNLVRLAGNICPDNGNPPEGDKPPELEVGFAPASPQQMLYTPSGHTAPLQTGQNIPLTVSAGPSSQHHFSPVNAEITVQSAGTEASATLPEKEVFYTPSGRTAPLQTGQNIPLTVSAGPSSQHHYSPVNAEISLQSAGTEASATLAGKKILPSVSDEVLMTYLRTPEGVVRKAHEIIDALHQDGLGAGRQRVCKFKQTHLPPSSRLKQTAVSDNMLLNYLRTPEGVVRKPNEIIDALHQDGLGAKVQRVRNFLKKHVADYTIQRKRAPSLAVTEAVARRLVEENGLDELKIITLKRDLKNQGYASNASEVSRVIKDIKAEHGVFPKRQRPVISADVLSQEILTPLPNGDLRSRTQLTHALSKNYNVTDQSITEAIARLQAEGKVIGGQPTGKKLSLPPENPWVPVAPEQTSLGSHNK